MDSVRMPEPLDALSRLPVESNKLLGCGLRRAEDHDKAMKYVLGLNLADTRKPRSFDVACLFCTASRTRVHELYTVCSAAEIVDHGAVTDKHSK